MEAKAAQNDTAVASSSPPVEKGVNDESAKGITMDAQTSPTSRIDEAIPAARLDAASSGSRPQESDSTPQTVEVNGEQTQQDNTTLNAPPEADGEAQNLDHELQQGLDNQLGDDHVLEIDDAEGDSALGSDTESTTTSIMSSIYRYREEHGRTYHAYKDGKYYLPNDERESSRLDFMHDTFRMTYGGKLYLSPLSKLENALDIGTGTGIWAIDLADENPECQVTGIDLSPSQPDLVPPNAKFIVDDAEDSWVYREKFDLIHARLMAGSFADWPKLFREAYDNLEPGGWLELQEFELPVRSQDGTHKNTNIHKWGELLCEAARNFGRPMGADVCDLFVQQMQDVGFVDVQQRNFLWPTNAWPKDPFMKELGQRTLINCLDGLEGFCLALLTRGLGWKKEEVDVFVAMVANDFKDRKIHSFIPMPVTFGRKPFDHEKTFS